MRDFSAIKERYMQDVLSIRLGGLAANLARVNSFSDHPDHCEAVEYLLEESKFFIEWTVPDSELNVQAELVDLQIQLAVWQHNWTQIWNDPLQRTAVAHQAGEWSKKVLDMSGLLS